MGIFLSIICDVERHPNVHIFKTTEVVLRYARSLTPAFSPFQYVLKQIAKGELSNMKILRPPI